VVSNYIIDYDSKHSLLLPTYMMGQMVSTTTDCPLQWHVSCCHGIIMVHCLWDSW